MQVAKHGNHLRRGCGAINTTTDAEYQTSMNTVALCALYVQYGLYYFFRFLRFS